MNGKSIFSFSKILSGATSTFEYINKAIPVYKQISPMVKNAYKTINSYKEIKDAAKEATFKDIKSFDRPKTIFKKNHIFERGKFDIDKLSFFSEKKN